MSSVNEFLDLFSDVWTSGLFGVNVSEIIIGLIIFLIFYVLRSFFARFVIGRLYKIVKKTKHDKDIFATELVVRAYSAKLKYTEECKLFS